MTAPWFEAFVVRGDLRRGDELLAVESGWFEIGLRGRVASLSLQEEKARRLFATSIATWEIDQPQEPVDILRLSLVGAFQFEDEILWDRLDATIDPLSSVASFDDSIDEFEQLPLIAAAVRARLLLTIGRDQEALAEFRDLLGRVAMLPRERTRIGPSDQAIWRCGCACALANLGDEAEAVAELEKAGLETCAAKYPIYQGLLAARLAAIHEHLRRADDAEEWRVMLRRLDLPSETKDLFDRRGRMMVERSVKDDCLVLL